MAVFNAVAGSYDNWYESKTGGFADMVETKLALEMFAPYKGMKVLDVGCGTGNFSIKLARLECEVTGIDVSGEMIGIAREKTLKSKPDIDFLCMDVHKTGFDDGYFDGAFSMAAFEFIERPLLAFNEIFRVVKKSGRILIGTINKSSRWGKLYLSEEVQKNSIFKYADFKTAEELKKWRPENLAKLKQCLFIPPDAKDEELTVENEEKLSKTKEGGFICSLWRK
jgi:ubiquinone/menaquinone biosynthesis C-methylase UbiE